MLDSVQRALRDVAVHRAATGDFDYNCWMIVLTNNILDLAVDDLVTIPTRFTSKSSLARLLPAVRVKVDRLHHPVTNTIFDALKGPVGRIDAAARLKASTTFQRVVRYVSGSKQVNRVCF